MEEVVWHNNSCDKNESYQTLNFILICFCYIIRKKPFYCILFETICFSPCVWSCFFTHMWMYTLRLHEIIVSMLIATESLCINRMLTWRFWSYIGSITGQLFLTLFTLWLHWYCNWRIDLYQISFCYITDTWPFSFF